MLVSCRHTSLLHFKYMDFSSNVSDMRALVTTFKVKVKAKATALKSKAKTKAETYKAKAKACNTIQYNKKL